MFIARNIIIHRKKTCVMNAVNSLITLAHAWKIARMIPNLHAKTALLTAINLNIEKR